MIFADPLNGVVFVLYVIDLRCCGVYIVLFSLLLGLLLLVLLLVDHCCLCLNALSCETTLDKHQVFLHGTLLVHQCRRLVHQDFRVI